MKTYQAQFPSGAVRTMDRIASEPPWAWRWRSPMGEIYVEKFATAASEAAEKSIKRRFESIHGRIPSPTFSPLS